MYLGFMFFLCIIQFIPLSFDLYLKGTPLESSLRDKNVLIVAGFCMGLVILIFFDILFDAVMGNRTMWISRSAYFWVPFIQGLMIISSKSNSMGALYIIYSDASIIFFSGRAFFDLCRFDSTKTWTCPKSASLVTLLAIATILSNLSLHFQFSAVITAIQLTMSYVYLACVMFNLLLCTWRVSSKYSSYGIFSRIHHMTYEESISVTMCITVFLSGIGFGIIPLLNPDRGVNDVSERSPGQIIAEMLVRSTLACALGLLPSIFLKHKANALEGDLDMKSIFVRSVSHEVRTPLNVVLSGLDTLHRMKQMSYQRRDEEEEKEMIVQMIDSCKGIVLIIINLSAMMVYIVAVTILDDLLSYEKLSQGIMQIETAPVQVMSFLHSAVSLFEIQARNKNIRLVILDETSTETEPLYFCVDHGKMTQVLRNLISNAIKFTPENGQVQIKASERQNKTAGPSVVVRVSDSGAGMTRDQMKKLFKHVVQFNANKLQGGGGSGIGLW